MKSICILTIATHFYPTRILGAKNNQVRTLTVTLYGAKWSFIVRTWVRMIVLSFPPTLE